MPGQLSNAVKDARSQAAIAVADKMNGQYRLSTLGSEQQVLFEEISDGYYTGHAMNSVRVYVKGAIFITRSALSGSLSCSGTV